MLIDARFHEALSAFIASSSMLALAAAVFFGDPRSRLHRFFSLYCLSIVWWSGSYFFASIASTLAESLFWLRFEKIGAPFIPYLFLLVIHELLGRPMPRWWRWSWVLSVMLGATAMTPFMFVGARRVANGMLIGSPGIGLALLAIFFWALVLYGSSCVWRARCRSAGLRRHQLNLVFWSSVMGYTGGGINFFHHFGIPLYPLEPIGTYLVGGYALVLAYAIFTVGILNLKIVVKKSVAYSLLVILVSVTYLLAGLITERLLQGVIGYRSFISSLIAGLTIAIGFVPLKDWIQSFVDRYFFKGTAAALAAENERLLQEVQRAEKLKAVSVFAAGMAHEIKNPLATLKTFAEYLPQKYDDAGFRAKCARLIGQEVGRIQAIVQRLLDFATPAPPHLQPVRASAMVEETLEFLQQELLRKQLRLTRHYDDRDLIVADPAQLKQVLLNLLLNAIEATPAGGAITAATTPNGRELTITIADTGCGMDARTVARLGEPFFTTKPSGTGLGLSVVHGIVAQHGGRMTVTSRLGEGTRISIELPLAQ